MNLSLLEPDLSSYGIRAANVLRNASPAKLYEEAFVREHGPLKFSK
ncbi:MAG: hypothetical protein LBF88_01670 [Planctomycetaceae bacterium]|jgi:hypothetical protein|nr:hypothetical protein [Planctomycetaceae bacterium]